MRSFAILSVLACLFLNSYPFTANCKEIPLAPIVKEGTPADALDADPVVSPTRKSVRQESATGSVLGSLSQELPYPVADRGSAGALSQIRGLGRSAEDTNVQTLGIPLNFPQGGGFDLSIFPQYLWTSLEFQPGPTLGAFDPRGVAGSLYLVPWSASALAPGEPRWARASELVTSDNLNQLAVGGKGTEAGWPVAAVAGYSSGKARGPSGSLSARAHLGGATFTGHVLATDLDTQTPGPAGFSPQAHQQSTRLIPVGQLDLPVGESALLKSSVYFDWSVLRYESEPGGFATHDRIQQAGAENAILWESWRLGVSARRTAYEQPDFEPPVESVLNLQLSRELERGALLVEPTLRGVWVSARGLSPEGSLGARLRLGEFAAVFARATFSRRVPSLQDRYYVLPPLFGGKGFAGNPDLGSERDYTAILGAEHRGGSFETSLQLFGQWRDQGQVLAAKDANFDTLVNAGSASIFSIMGSVTVRPLNWMDLVESVTLSQSNIRVPGAADQEYFYSPSAIDALGWVAHEPGDRPLWSLGIWARFASSALASASGDRVAGYGLFDAHARLTLWNGVYLYGTIDNLFNRPVNVLKDYPLGRIFAMQLAAAI